MSYTPPSGNAIQITFTASYTPPNGNTIVIELVAAGGQNLFPSGWDSSSFGTPLLPVLKPSGWDSSSFGSTTINYDADFIAPSGWDSSAFGTPVMGRTLVASGFTGTLYGTPRDVDYAIRYRYMAGWDSLGIGTSTIGTRRFLEPLGSTHTQFGTAFISDLVRTLAESGFDGAAVGTPTIDYVRLLPSGLDSLELGGPHTIKLGVRFLLDAGFTATAFGSAEIYNRTTYVGPYSIPQLSSQEHAQFGTAVLTGPSDPLQVSGFAGTLYGVTLIETPQRPLVPAGWDDNAVGAANIGHSVRTVTATGLDAGLHTDGAIVYNAAYAALPAGIDSQAIGTADIRDRAQTVRVDTLWNATSYGAAFIADGVRTVAVYHPPEPVVPIGPHSVELGQRYLVPSGIDSALIPPPEARQFRLTLLPQTMGSMTALGSPTVTNRNFEIRNDSSTFSEYGRPKIFNAKLEVTGFVTLEFGTTVIRERTQRVQAVGWASLVVPNASVRHDPPIPALQRLRPTGWESLDVQGVVHDITGNALYPEGIDSAEYGDTAAELRAIRPQGWIDSDTFDLFGTPFLSYDQRAYPDGFEVEPFGGQVPQPRLSPNYIFAPRSDIPVDSTLQKMGTPDVTDGTRTVAVAWSSIVLQSTEYGTPRGDLKNRKVFVNGLNAFRYGRPQMGGGISSYPISAAEFSAGYGAATIAHVPVYDPNVYPTGIAPPSLTGNAIELKNRSVTPVGFTASELPGVIDSPSGVYFTPLTYGPPDGFDATVFGGGTFIADRIRYLQPTGWTATNQKASYPLHARARRNPSGTTPVHALR